MYISGKLRCVLLLAVVGICVSIYVVENIKGPHYEKFIQHKTVQLFNKVEPSSLVPKYWSIGTENGKVLFELDPGKAKNWTALLEPREASLTQARTPSIETKMRKDSLLETKVPNYGNIEEQNEIITATIDTEKATEKAKSIAKNLSSLFSPEMSNNQKIERKNEIISAILETEKAESKEKNWTAALEHQKASPTHAEKPSDETKMRQTSFLLPEMPNYQKIERQDEIISVKLATEKAKSIMNNKTALLEQQKASPTHAKKPSYETKIRQSSLLVPEMPNYQKIERKNEIISAKLETEKAESKEKNWTAVLEPQKASLTRYKKNWNGAKMRGVIILTRFRSGSTFCGELFNQHPGVYYSFEPLYPFGPTDDSQLPRRVEVLYNLMKCTFREMKSLYSEISKKPTRPFDKKCIEHNVCFRFLLRELCSTKYCATPNRCMECGTLDIKLLRDICKSKKVTATKIIRLNDILALKQMVNDPSLDIKIIHLARDPRGIASSRKKLGASNLQTLKEDCGHLKRSKQLGETVDWLKGRYKLVRYEDLASDPFKIAQEIYDFVGLPFLENIKSWINESTQMKGSGWTKRNSTETLRAWRTHLTFPSVKDVQEICKETMHEMGYKLFESEAELFNYNLSAF